MLCAGCSGSPLRRIGDTGPTYAGSCSALLLLPYSSDASGGAACDEDDEALGMAMLLLRRLAALLPLLLLLLPPPAWRGVPLLVWCEGLQLLIRCGAALAVIRQRLEAAS